MSCVIRAAIAALLVGVPPLAARAAGEADYASAEQAFEAVFIASGIGQRGYDENREYAAALYQMRDGRWYSTPVVAGGLITSAIPYHAVPAEATRIAGAHTHGQPQLRQDDARVYGVDFSQTDRLNAMRAYHESRGKIDTQLLLNSNLEILRMTIALRYEPALSRITLTSETRPVGRRAAGTVASAPVIAMQRDSAAMDR